MKREIKFRVWIGNDMEYNVVAGRFGVFYVNPENGNGLDPKDSASLTPCNTKYPDDIPLMQFTGLKDKNGKEIYESDIVEWTSKFKGTEIPTPPKRGQIQYNDQGCVFHIIYELNGIHYYKELNADTGGEDYSMTSIEVVGNIYENPELLK